MKPISNSELRGFVPTWGKETPARDIYGQLTAAGYRVRIKPQRRKKNRLSDNPDKGRIRALATMLNGMSDIGHTTRKETGALKYYHSGGS